MKKIISLFQRNYDGDRLVRDELVPGAEWVAAGEGRATQKVDGTAVMVKGGVLYKRYDAKHGKQPPEGFIPAQDPDPVTGHWSGWVLASSIRPEDRWIFEAYRNYGEIPPDGTYEACGPKINNNNERLDLHHLIPHGHYDLDRCPRDFARLRAYLAETPAIEGVVWHHPDGRMVKIKRRDFGLPWPA